MLELTSGNVKRLTRRILPIDALLEPLTAESVSPARFVYRPALTRPSAISGK